VISNRLLVKLCLLFGESHRDGLSFDRKRKAKPTLVELRSCLSTPQK
jgi:hypothetical protein